MTAESMEQENTEQIGQKFTVAHSRFKNLQTEGAPYSDRREAYYAEWNVVEAHIIAPLRAIIYTGKRAVVTVTNDKGGAIEQLFVGRMGCIINGDRLQYSRFVYSPFRESSFRFDQVVSIRPDVA